MPAASNSLSLILSLEPKHIASPAAQTVPGNIVANGGWDVRQTRVLEKSRARRSWRLLAATFAMCVLFGAFVVWWNSAHLYQASVGVFALLGLTLVTLLVRSVHLSWTEAPVEREITEYVDHEHSGNSVDTLY